MESHSNSTACLPLRQAEARARHQQVTPIDGVVTLCRRCVRYGHLTASCRAPEPRCLRCAEAHKTDSCTSATRRCPHCASARLRKSAPMRPSGSVHHKAHSQHEGRHADGGQPWPVTRQQTEDDHPVPLSALAAAKMSEASPSTKTSRLTN